MVKIKSELVETYEPTEGQTYIIQAVEEVTTTVRGFKGYRIALKSTDKKDEKQYSTMLWERERASMTSKLGAFLKAFKEFLPQGEDYTDSSRWIGHIIKINKWTPRQREVVVIQ
ncbi:MAG: hypothetical protein NC827_05900 [Candidatus Omnitrophica bacterium]|nr:hypothetical protein [Candidatus Omnitrophota bacterium]